MTLAGLPASVIERAKVVLAQIEAEERVSPARRLIDDLPLFASARPAAPQKDSAQDSALMALLEALAALNPDEMSPRDALEALYALKAQLAKGKL
jgi:DNA mismatch repair protein MutS